MKRQSGDDSMYTGEACPKCGSTKTLKIGHGSIWCPDEDAHPGGFWVRRVAFAQPPARDGQPRLSNPLPQRVKRQPVPRIASAPTAPPVKVAPKDDGFDVGFDSFIEKPR